MTEVKDRNKIIPLTYDLAFKKMFGENTFRGKLRCAVLLSKVLDLEFLEVVKKLTFLNTEKRLNNKNDKRRTTDIIVKIRLSDKNEKYCNLELNMNTRNLIINRNLEYLSELFGNQLKNKEDYLNIKTCIQINFNSKEMGINRENRIYRKYKMINEIDVKDVLTDNLQIININLEECRRIYYNEDINEYNGYEKEIILLGTLIRENDKRVFEKVLEEIKMEDKIKEDICNTCEEFNSDNEIESLYYDKEELDRWIFEGSMIESKEEGKKEGIITGKSEKEKEIAQNMLKEKVNEEFILKVTGITKEELEKLKNSF